MNTITIFGRLTDNPESRYTQDGKMVVNFSLADNYGQNKVSYFRCTAFGKTAENILKATKAQRLVITGEMQEESWTDQQSGQERKGWKAIVSKMNYVESKQEAQGQQQPPQNYGQPPAQGYAPPTPQPGYNQPPVQPGYGQAPPQAAPNYAPQPGYVQPPVQQPQQQPASPQNYGNSPWG